MKKLISILIALGLCLSLQSCAVITDDEVYVPQSTTEVVITSAATATLVALSYYWYWDGVRYLRHPCDIYYAPSAYFFGGPHHYYDTRVPLYYKGHRHHPVYDRSYRPHPDRHHRPDIRHHEPNRRIGSPRTPARPSIAPRPSTSTRPSSPARPSMQSRPSARMSGGGPSRSIGGSHSAPSRSVGGHTGSRR